MPIHHWTLERAGDLAECYNRQIAGLPYCYPQSSEGFVQGIQEDLQELYGWSRDYLHSEKMIVAEEGSGLAGFVHVGVEEKEEKGYLKKRGIIRFLGYEPGHRPIGQALLDETERQFQHWGITDVLAFSKGYIYHFCSPDGGYSELAGHISGLLGINGYKISGRTVNMALENLQLSEPVIPDQEVQIAVAGDNKRSKLPQVNVRAYASGGSPDDAFGECFAYPLEHVQSAEGAQDQIYINWLGVNGEFQGKGWGRYLLLRALWEAQKVGYKHSVLATDERNHRAQLFYTNYGYWTTHSSYSYSKDLSE